MDGKIIRGAVWDTFSVAVATIAASVAMPGRINFFQTKKSPPTKGLHLTNMNKDGEFASPERISIYSAPRLVFIGMAEADVAAICKKYAVVLEVNGSTVFEAPLVYCAGGGGVSSQPQNGSQTLEAVVQFAEELRIDIEAGQRFNLSLVCDQDTPPTPAGSDANPAGKGVYIQAILDGIRTLPVG